MTVPCACLQGFKFEYGYYSLINREI